MGMRVAEEVVVSGDGVRRVGVVEVVVYDGGEDGGDDGGLWGRG